MMKIAVLTFSASVATAFGQRYSYDDLVAARESFHFSESVADGKPQVSVVQADGTVDQVEVTNVEVEDQLKKFVKVIAVRHGTSKWNDAKKNSPLGSVGASMRNVLEAGTLTNASLTAQGVTDAETLRDFIQSDRPAAEELKQHAADDKLFIAASNLDRAIHTGLIAFESLVTG